MAQSEDPIILWCGRFSKADGYGTVSRNHLRGLDLIGARYSALDIDTRRPVGPRWDPALEISGFEPVLVRAKDPDDRVVVVFHERPDRYPLVRVDGRARLVGHSVFETDGLPPGWASLMTSVDEIWAATEFNRRSFARGGVPSFMIDKLPHSLDTDLYRSEIGGSRLGNPDETVFLTVCTGLQRRDLGLVFRSFLRTFTPDSPVRYVVKLRGRAEAVDASRALLDRAVAVVGGDATAVADLIDLRGVDLGAEEMVRLYQSCDVYVSAERANGWDLPTMESMACGKLTIGFHTGGSTEYANERVGLRLPVTEAMLPIESQEAHEFYVAQWWPAVDESLMDQAMRRAVDPELRARLGAAAADHIHRNYDVRVVARRIVDQAAEYGPVDFRSGGRAEITLGRDPVWRDADLARRRPPIEWSKAVLRTVKGAPRRIARAGVGRRRARAVAPPTPGGVGVVVRGRARGGVRRVAAIARSSSRVVLHQTDRQKAERTARAVEHIRSARYDPQRVWTEDDLADRRLAFGRHPLIELPEEERDALRALRDRHAGERCFIIGNGPSLNRTELPKLADEFTFGVNKIYLLYDRIDWRPSFYTLLDWRVGPEIEPHVGLLRNSVKFFPNRFRGILPPGHDTYWYTTRPVLDHLDDQFRPTIIDGIPSKGTILVTAIQIAFHLGFRDLYLIGADASYTIPSTVRQSGPDRFGTGVRLNLESTEDDDPNHFDPTYFGKGAKWHDPNVNEMIRQFRQMRKGVEFHGGRIRNATAGGELEVFERVDYDSLF